ncbi:PP2C family protein-serine/threonine phosphatase [Adhaeretor mobilis]|uniref:PP2C family protein-serine/threonine phosphatase n=1 Tax=Adhaeretor mobilis TaxID=1930276 RepID=UPI001C54F2BC|nr:protein phosphatase 2C domain-containing protein [Adhaeretor mobilis]
MSQESVKLSKAVGGLRCAAVSDVGMRRANNQDSLAVAIAEEEALWSSRGHLFVVADGMGAHAAGELASQIAADCIPHTYHKRRDLAPCEALLAAVHDANARINTKGQNSVDFHGMGTTCSCLALLPGGAVAAHVGDSRVYRLRGDAFEQITFDHSLVWEMAVAGQANEEDVPAYVPKNVITRSLGPNGVVKVDLEGPFALQTGDRFLLCSDGLTGPLSSQLIGLIVGALPTDDATQTLVDLANLLGGPDNITVIVAEVYDTRELGQHDASNPECDPPPANSSADQLPLLSALGVGLIGVVGCPLLWGVEHRVAAGALAVVTGLAAGLLMYARNKPSVTGASLPSPQGKAPYRRYETAPGPESIKPLVEIVRQLEDLEGQRDWQFDWNEIHAERESARNAIAKKDFRGAIVAYSRAVRILMQAVRDSTPEPPSDSSINLGVD